MTTSAQSIVFDAQTVLQDFDGIRWPASELVRHLNRSQKDIQIARPDTTSTMAEMTLAAGYKQTLPANCAVLIDIPSNVTGERVTKTDLVTLDAVESTWRKRTPVAVIKHFMHDVRTPRTFLVYPPATDTAKVDLEHSAYPVDVSAPGGDGKAASTVTGDISLADQWSTALLCMVLHYAYAKDAEYGGNASLSTAYLQRAEGILGVQLQSSATVAPKS